MNIEDIDENALGVIAQKIVLIKKDEKLKRHYEWIEFNGYKIIIHCKNKICAINCIVQLKETINKVSWPMEVKSIDIPAPGPNRSDTIIHLSDPDIIIKTDDF